MGIWAGIKYALNSTLGTADFKPLDQIMHKYTLGTKQFISPGTDLEIIYASGGVLVGDHNAAETIILGTFAPAIDGYVGVTALISTTYYTGAFYIKDLTDSANDFEYTVPSERDEGYRITVRLKVIAGHQYQLSVTGRRCYILDASITAGIVDTGIYNYTLGG